MKERNKKGQFNKGFNPWNKNKRMNINLKKIEKEHIKGKSILDISKELGISDRIIRIRLKENNMFIRDKYNPSKETKDKIKNTMIRKGIQPKERYSGKVWNKGLTQEDNRVKENIKGLLENRKYQITPLKDTSIEIKIKELLEQLNIKFIQHYFIKDIRHSYQCDFFIPQQERINKKIVLETDGCYWHGCKECSKELNSKQRSQIAKDNKRNKELIGRGYKVIRLWEHEIRLMHLNEFKDTLLTF